MYFGEAATQSAVSLSRSERKKHKALNSFSVEILLLMIFSSFKKKCDFFFSLSSFFFFSKFFFNFFSARVTENALQKREGEKKKGSISCREERVDARCGLFFFSLESARAAERKRELRRAEARRSATATMAEQYQQWQFQPYYTAQGMYPVPGQMPGALSTNPMDPYRVSFPFFSLLLLLVFSFFLLSLSLSLAFF